MQERLEANLWTDKGELLKNIASEYRVGISTMSYQKTNLKIFCKDSLGEWATWWGIGLSGGIPLSGPILQEKLYFKI